ncbi:universal stress protein UspA [Candidatus Fukatsuia symbiotica]|uniref:Universal stress protein n=1 Tax=Candidatus Fukatsuia symbiotica TaxID=1878942 RepID=A0A2U8I932_9GAMM|nr:universal stress protein UspA [Candidatus Fukatsuia symbiotica]AWK14504.1 universal stress global response regulator UspA [Candidatus Fukatsuia symbiotica]MEA9444796.1 universal stress protein UspA [Candidatus Fukatsuia symbiotica]
MAYKHILIAVDLSSESKMLVEKAVSIARPYDAKISLVHVNVNYTALSSSLMDVHIGDMQESISEKTDDALKQLADEAGYPIEQTRNASGSLVSALVKIIEECRIDLVLCGHHQDVWSKFVSSARELINSLPVDMLIVPLLEVKETENS